MLNNQHQCVFDGDGIALQHSLCSPLSVAVWSGNIFIADFGNQRVRKVVGQTMTTLAGSTAGFAGDGGLAVSALFNRPVGIATDSTGAVFVADDYNNRVRRLTQYPVVKKVN